MQIFTEEDLQMHQAAWSDVYLGLERERERERVCVGGCEGVGG